MGTETFTGTSTTDAERILLPEGAVAQGKGLGFALGILHPGASTWQPPDGRTVVPTRVWWPQGQEQQGGTFLLSDLGAGKFWGGRGGETEALCLEKPLEKPHLWVGSIPLEKLPVGIKSSVPGDLKQDLQKPRRPLRAPEDRDSRGPHPFQVHKGMSGMEKQAEKLRIPHLVTFTRSSATPRAAPIPPPAQGLLFTPETEPGICSFCLIQPHLLPLPLLPNPFQCEIPELKLAGIRSSAGLPPSHTPNLFF